MTFNSMVSFIGALRTYSLNVCDVIVFDDNSFSAANMRHDGGLNSLEGKLTPELAEEVIEIIKL